MLSTDAVLMFNKLLQHSSEEIDRSRKQFTII